MLKKLIKNTKIKLASCILAGMLSGILGTSCYNEEETEEMMKIYCKSYSSENSINKVFVTGEEIDVSIVLNEEADKLYLEEERYYQKSSTANSYEMERIPGTNTYALKLSAFSDSGILCFAIKSYQGETYTYSREICKPVFISEADARSTIKNWLDEKNSELQPNYVDYNENEKLTNCKDIEADFNLKKVEGTVLASDAIVGYVGENDKYYYAVQDEESLTNCGINHTYIFPSYPISYLEYPEYLTPRDIINKNDLENKISNFYYWIDYYW